MDGHKEVYSAITDIWHLWKKYGSEKLGDAQWEAFLREGQGLRMKHETAGDEVDMFFRDLFMALQKYYGRKETGQ